MFFLGQTAFSETGWKTVDDMRWDAKTAFKLDSNRVKFFYDSPFREEQKRYAIKEGFFSPEVASRIAYERWGMVVDCKTAEYGVFSFVYLKVDGSPVAPADTVDISVFGMQSIDPETKMETLMNDVCKFFGLHK